MTTAFIEGKLGAILEARRRESVELCAVFERSNSPIKAVSCKFATSLALFTLNIQASPQERQ